jgi:hypothetical protein
MKPKPASKLVRHGLPLISLTILGWFGLAYAVKGRIDVQVRTTACRNASICEDRRNPITKTYVERFPIITVLQDAKRQELDLRAPIEKQRAKKFNIDEELDRLMKESKLDYENKPVPRPRDY